MNNPNLSSMSIRELLSAILNSNLAERLIDQFESLDDVTKASYEEFVDAGIHPSDVQRIRGVFELGTRYWSQGPKIRKVNSSGDAFEILEPLLQNKDQEMVRAILLDKRRSVLEVPLITVGTLSSSLVHPREVFKQAVRINAKFMVMAHQHPSGDPTPSRDDFITTTRIVNAGKILGIEVLDHVIIGSNGRYYSFSDNGTL